MAIFVFSCPTCSLEAERLISDFSTVTIECPKCGGTANKKITAISFIPPEGDLTYVSVRDRCKKGLYWDQNSETRKESRELTAEMQNNNSSVMGSLGFTEKQDIYNRSEDY